MYLQDKSKKENVVMANASTFKRLFAFLVDLFIVNSFVLIPMRKLLDKIPIGSNFGLAYEVLSADPQLKSFVVAVTFASALVLFVYFILFEMILNQSLGKMLFNIYIIPDLTQEEISKRGFKIGFLQAFVRNLFVFPFFPLILLWIIDPITLIFSKKKQRLSEILSKTRTIEKFIKN